MGTDKDRQIGLEIGKSDRKKPGESQKLNWRKLLNRGLTGFLLGGCTATTRGVFCPRPAAESLRTTCEAARFWTVKNMASAGLWPTIGTVSNVAAAAFGRTMRGGLFMVACVWSGAPPEFHLSVGHARNGRGWGRWIPTLRDPRRDDCE